MNNIESNIFIRVVKYRDDIIFGKYSDYTSALDDGTLLWESIINDNNLSNTEKKLLLKEVKKAINLITDSIIMVKEREKAILEAKNNYKSQSIFKRFRLMFKNELVDENNINKYTDAELKKKYMK